MDQGGFDFRKPSERRDARRFEPPPWEQDAFEELRRKREAEEARLNEAGDAEQRPVDEENATKRPLHVPEVRPHEQEPEPAAEAQRPAAEAEPGASKAGEIDEARMIELMAGLSSETPRAKSMAISLTLGFGGLLAVFGLGLTVWGGVIMARAQGSGRLLALVLVVMGLAYLAVGAGLGYRALKERGVL